MQAIIRVDVPEWQIGEEVTICFKDSMLTKGICEKDTKPKKSEVDANYAKVNAMLFDYFERRKDEKLREAISSIDRDPYQEIINLYYRDRMKIEQIAELYRVDTSTIVRNKRRICLALYNSINEE